MQYSVMPMYMKARAMAQGEYSTGVGTCVQIRRAQVPDLTTLDGKLSLIWLVQVLLG